jgi:16S rRNA (uracil1498-N3)-methyltransferase
MRVSRFYIEQPLATDQSLTVTGTRSHYIRNVLRLKSGDSLILFNGQGGEYQGKISSADRNKVDIEVGEFSSNDRKSPLEIDIGLAVSKHDAMDFAIQKATELGVSRIQPLIVSHSSISLSATDKKISHWQEICHSACEQCGLNRPPAVLPLIPFSEWITISAELCLITEPQGELKLDGIAVTPKHVAIAIGPEGGFTPAEISQAWDQKFTGINLGTRILRLETATISMLTLVQSKWGDL